MQVRSLILCAKISTDMPWSTSNRFVQNAAQFIFSPPLGKSLNIFEEFEGLSLVDTNYAPRDSPRPLKEKLAMSPSYPLPMVMGVSMIPSVRVYIYIFFGREPACSLFLFCLKIKVLTGFAGALPSNRVYEHKTTRFDAKKNIPVSSSPGKSRKIQSTRYLVIECPSYYICCTRKVSCYPLKYICRKSRTMCTYVLI